MNHYIEQAYHSLACLIINDLPPRCRPSPPRRPCPSVVYLHCCCCPNHNLVRLHSCKEEESVVSAHDGRSPTTRVQQQHNILPSAAAPPASKLLRVRRTGPSPPPILRLLSRASLSLRKDLSGTHYLVFNEDLTTDISTIPRWRLSWNPSSSSEYRAGCGRQSTVACGR